MSEHDKLVSEIERFMRRAGMSQTRFGIESCGDRAFMTRLYAGKGCTLDRVDKVRRFMRSYDFKKKTSRKRLEQMASA